jgi:hypothetical protein
MSGKKPDLHINKLHFCRESFLPADFKISIHLIKTEYIKIATFFQSGPVISKIKLVSKKIFDKGDNLTQNTPKRTSNELGQV